MSSASGCRLLSGTPFAIKKKKKEISCQPFFLVDLPAVASFETIFQIMRSSRRCQWRVNGFSSRPSWIQIAVCSQTFWIKVQPFWSFCSVAWPGLWCAFTGRAVHCHWYFFWNGLVVAGRNAKSWKLLAWGSGSMLLLEWKLVSPGSKLSATACFQGTWASCPVFFFPLLASTSLNLEA